MSIEPKRITVALIDRYKIKDIEAKMTRYQANYLLALKNIGDMQTALQETVNALFTSKNISPEDYSFDLGSLEFVEKVSPKGA